MKKLFLITFLFPLCSWAQPCIPYAEINGHKGTSEITIAELASLSKITVSGTCHGEKYFVTSFEFTMMRKNQPLSLAGWSATLDDKIKKALLGAEAGSKVYFDNIKAKGIKETVDVAGITLKIKN